MLILVAVTVRTVIQSGLFGHAEKATSGYSMHQAREQLGTTLAGAMAEKYTNKDYNEDDFLDEYIKDNLPGSQIAGDVVLVYGWAFELDRTVPEIVNDLGKGNPEDFKSPELTVAKGTLAEDKLSIPLNITALEDINGISKIEVYKYGEKTPLQIITCSNEKTQVAKIFTATENTKYKIVAYSKLRATKTVEVTEIPAPTPQVGDFVRYTPDVAENYLIDAKYSGYTSDQSIPQDTELKWQIMNMNTDGSIDIIADKPIEHFIYLQGSLGCNNGVYFLNNLCKTQYSNANLGAIGRSINLIDIESRMNSNGFSAKESNSFYNKKFYYYGPPTLVPDVYDYTDRTPAGESLNYYSAPTTQTHTSQPNILLTTSTYSLAQLESYYNNSDFYNIIYSSTKPFTLATRFLGEYSANYASFGLRIINQKNIGYDILVFAHYQYDKKFFIRPVVTLPANLDLKQISGTLDWEIIHTNNRTQLMSTYKQA